MQWKALMKNPWGLEECLLWDGFFLVPTLPADLVFSWEEKRTGQRSPEDGEWSVSSGNFTTSVGMQCDRTFSCVLAVFPLCHRSKIQSPFQASSLGHGDSEAWSCMEALHAGCVCIEISSMNFNTRLTRCCVFLDKWLNFGLSFPTSKIRIPL